jgi:hypothetical protein
MPWFGAGWNCVGARHVLGTRGPGLRLYSLEMLCPIAEGSVRSEMDVHWSRNE